MYETTKYWFGTCSWEQNRWNELRTPIESCFVSPQGYYIFGANKYTTSLITTEIIIGLAILSFYSQIRTIIGIFIDHTNAPNYAEKTGFPANLNMRCRWMHSHILHLWVNWSHSTMQNNFMLHTFYTCNINFVAYQERW